MYWSRNTNRHLQRVFKGNIEGTGRRKRRGKQLLNDLKETDAGFVKRMHWIAFCVELALKRLRSCRKTNYVPNFTL